MRNDQKKKRALALSSIFALTALCLMLAGGARLPGRTVRMTRPTGYLPRIASTL